MRVTMQRIVSIAILAALTVGIAVLIWKGEGTERGKIGDKPGYAVVGELPDALLRQRWVCDNVVATSDSVWVVGSLDSESPPAELGRDADEIPDLSSLVKGSQKRQPTTISNMYGASDVGGVQTTLSRLTPDGNFRVMATLPGNACLRVLPDSDTLLLLTDLEVPEDKDNRQLSDGSPVGQSIILRSSDNGDSWHWVSTGMMVEVEPYSGPLTDLNFYSDQEVWSWGMERYYNSDGWPRQEPDGNYITELGYSDDQGTTSVRITSDKPIKVTQAYIKSLLPAEATDLTMGTTLKDSRFVVQTSSLTAYAWVSQPLSYRQNDERSSMVVTSRAKLVRPSTDASWQVSDVTRTPGLRIRHVKTGENGEAHAIIRSDSDGWQMARLAPDTGEWVGRHDLPELMPRWLFDVHRSVSHFWSNGRYQVVNLHESHDLPQLIPFYSHNASFYTTSHFYTDDGGASWHQLAIPGNRDAVLGMENHGDRLFWSKGRWYEDKGPGVWSYDLSQ
ncbi:hypothetical protein J8402_00705 [Chromohalobacter israelensis]|uniref:hypothetical protein n=1 Tax=Chromohalobacter israelensis TaxID=141390 RepID=UPI003AF83595